MPWLIDKLKHIAASYDRGLVMLPDDVSNLLTDAAKVLEERDRAEARLTHRLAEAEKGLSHIMRLQLEQGHWADATFGRPRKPEGPIAHLRKEVEELAENPGDRLEYADCLMLLLDAYRLAGGYADDLVTAGFQKLEINRQRQWGKPDENGVVEHIRNQEISSNE